MSCLLEKEGRGRGGEGKGERERGEKKEMGMGMYNRISWMIGQCKNKGCEIINGMEEG